MALTIDRNRSLSEQLRDARDEVTSMRGDAGQIAGEFQRLAQMELELARAEMQEARGHATRGTLFGAMAAEYALLVSLFLFLAVMFALDTAMPLWAAALITTAIVAVVAALFGLLAKQQWSRFSPVPRRAVATVKEDIQWARNQLRLNRT